VDSHALVSRMRPFQRSVFGDMSRRAADLDAVNLGQGFPDEDGPESIREAAVAAIRSGRGNQYPPAHGLPELRVAIARHQERFYGLKIDPADEVVVATGASEAIAAAVLALVEPGQEVLMFDPYFDLYPAVVSLAGARRVAVPVTTDLRPDLAALERSISSRSRAVLLNSPHNPTGTVYTPVELVELSRIAREHDLLVIADEAYEHLWFDGHEHQPIATLPGMSERTVTIGSAGKSFSLTGWKVGWASGPADLIGAVRVVRQHLSYVSSGPFQWAIAEALASSDAYFTEFRHDLQRRRDLLCGGLARLGFDVIEPAGTYFATTDVRPLGFESGAEFCDVVPERAGVVAIPHSALSDHPERTGPLVRWAFCKRTETLAEGLRRLERM
jgi:N-succinyldiaminopimelate aminotransferase